MTTNRSKRPNQQMGLIKSALITGSVIATLAGTQLLARQTAAADTGIAPQTAVTIVVPADDQLPMPPTLSDRAVTVQLNPVPQAITPQINPIVRTRSSR